MMLTTGLYAALLGLLFVVLSVRTLRLRRNLRIAVGDAGNPKMLRAMRVHSNFAEYIPLSLLLIYLAEAQGANGLLIHALGWRRPLGARIREGLRLRHACQQSE